MVSVCLPSCHMYHLTWVSLTLNVGYLFTPAPAKLSRCSLPWPRDISSLPPLPTWTWTSSCRPSGAHAATAPWTWGCSSRPPPLALGVGSPSRLPPLTSDVGSSSQLCSSCHCSRPCSENAICYLVFIYSWDKDAITFWINGLKLSIMEQRYSR